ncbi:MAG: hypothetical protein KC766_14825 [Myxococcales bacterium]|nr:hypothetical protein [Myxococcales bacterium]
MWVAFGLAGALVGGCSSAGDEATACTNWNDCRADQNCVDRICQTVECGGDLPFVYEATQHWGASCVECREDEDCAADRFCSAHSNRGVYGQEPRCVPREGCDADDQCDFAEICVDDACVQGRRADCQGWMDCNGDELCEGGACLTLQCPEEEPFVGASEGGPFCEECRTSEDCGPGLICKDWDRSSVYPSPGKCVEPGCKTEQDCRLDQTCVDGSCVAVGT